MTERGSIAFDPPDRTIRADAGTGKWVSGNCLAWKQAWREKRREHVRTYHREYMRKYRARNSGE
jgi:hypothetical protein